MSIRRWTLRADQVHAAGCYPGFKRIVYCTLVSRHRYDFCSKFLTESEHIIAVAIRYSRVQSCPCSGGFINVFVVDSSGWKRITTDDAGFMEMRHNDHDVEDEGPPDRPRSKQSAGGENQVAVGGSNLPTATDGSETVDLEDDGMESGGHGGSR